MDEIGELPIDLQPKLLRALQEGEIERVGGVEVTKVNVRVIAATNRDLKEDSDSGKFRRDLYFRLNVFPIKVPALKDRVEDIPVLVDFFIGKYAPKYGKEISYISEDTLLNMQSYSWPGNVRELENSIERAVIRSSTDVLSLPEFSAKEGKRNKKISHLKSLTLDQVQRDHIVKVLTECKWKIGGVNGAAVSLGLKDSTLRDKMKKLSIKRPS